ncbi:MAG: hypothetical protein PVH61_11435 [Candidatus Aminicenantes bacterium]|jgi:hypothetical protein
MKILKGVTPGSSTKEAFEATTTGYRVYHGYSIGVLPEPVSFSTNDIFSVVIKFINSSFTFPRKSVRCLF